MVDSPHLTLKIVVIVHFVLSVWASMTPPAPGGFYLPGAYIYMNAFILAFAVWSIVSPESIDAILMFFILLTISIVMDIIFLGIYATAVNNMLPVYIQTLQVSSSFINAYRFSLGMSILNLILKPLSSFILFRLYRHRAGETNFPNFQIGVNAQQQQGYSTIDSGPHPSSYSRGVESAAPYSSIDKQPA